MKRLFVLSAGLMSLLLLNAQDNDFLMYPGAPPVIARISFITPCFVVELAPSDHFTFTTGFWIHPSFWEEEEDGSHQFRPVPALNPRITLEPRYFINLPRRMEKGKRTDYYSGWYVGMPFSLGLPDLRFSLGTTFGFQCIFGRRWYWNLGIGPGFTFKDERFRMNGSGTAGFGIILN
jgi:hypothetical protein